MSKRCSESNSGNTLLIAATTAAIALSQGKTADELEVLGEFFTVLGDSISLLALHAPSQNE